jgi:hypothetical protein
MSGSLGGSIAAASEQPPTGTPGPLRPGVTWGDLAADRPDIAAVGRRLLYSGEIGLGFLATVRIDGGPRVHPISPVLTESGLYAMIVPGPKLADLRRDRRYALHGETFPPPDEDDAVYVTGAAVEVDDPERWTQIGNQMLADRGLRDHWPGFDAMVLFELLVERCLVTLTRAAGGLPAGQTVWRAP